MRKKWYVVPALMLICSSAGCSSGDKNDRLSNKLIEESVDAESSKENNEGDSLDNNEVQTETLANVQTFPSEYHYESEFLDIDISNVTPHEAVWHNTMCKNLAIDYEKVGRLFMPDDGTNTMEKDGHVILSNETVDDNYKEIFGWGPNGCGYNKLEWGLLSCSIRSDMRYDDYNLDVYKEKKDFSFGTVEEVKQKLYDEFNEIGIDLENDFVCDTYYLDYNTMKEQEKYVYMEDEGEEIHPNRTDWSENDNAYYMFFHSVCNNLRDFQGTDMGNCNAMNESAQIKISYNKDGILSCDIQDLCEYTISDKQTELMDFEDIMNSVKEHYSNIVDGTKRKIITAELIADCADHASVERKVIPVWAFWVEEVGGNTDGYVHVYELRVNARTGAIMN